MEATYLCPRCQATLNPKDQIVLCAEVQGQRFLMLLSPRPGDYEVTLGQGLGLVPHSTVGLFCPVCQGDVHSERDPMMAELLVQMGPRRGRVVFSRIYGRHATYFITEQTVQSFGEDADTAGLNFWGLGPGA